MKPNVPAIVALIAGTLLCAAEEDEPTGPTEVSVKVAKVVRATLTRAITVYGTVEPEPATGGRPPASARLSPAEPGIITEIRGEVGARVQKGEVLFRLDSRAADSAVAKAEQAVQFAEKNAERQKKLIAADGTSKKSVLEAEQALAAAKTELAAAKVQQSLLRGEAPLSGTLVSFAARPGEAADATTVIAEIVDLDRLVVAVRVPRMEIAEVHAGDTAELRVTSDGKPISSSVIFVSPEVDAASDSVVAHLSVPKDAGLRPGQFIKAGITVEVRKDRLAVPLASVFTTPEGVSTLSVVDGGSAVRKVVKTGLRDGGLVEVEGEGLTEGQTVVTEGSYALPEETKVRVIPDTTK